MGEESRPPTAGLRARQAPPLPRVHCAFPPFLLGPNGSPHPILTKRTPPPPPPFLSPGSGLQ